MPIGSRTSSWPSMMNSWRRTCRICWSVGMFTARAVSIARSTSSALTSRSLIATMPVRVEAADVAAGDAGERRGDLAVGHQLGFLERALDRRHGGLDVDHHALLQALATRGCPCRGSRARRRARARPPAHATFEVPMSRPTMRFLFVFRPSALQLLQLRHAQREAVRVAQVDVLVPRARCSPSVCG